MTKTLTINNGFFAELNALATSTLSGKKGAALAGAFNSENSISVSTTAAAPEAPSAR